MLAQLVSTRGTGFYLQPMHKEVNTGQKSPHVVHVLRPYSGHSGIQLIQRQGMLVYSNKTQIETHNTTFVFKLLFH